MIVAFFFLVQLSNQFNTNGLFNYVMQVGYLVTVLLALFTVKNYIYIYSIVISYNYNYSFKISIIKHIAVEAISLFSVIHTR